MATSCQVAAAITPQATAASSRSPASKRHGDTDRMPLAVDIVGIVNIVAAVLGFLAIAALVVIAARPDRDRQREDEARAYYDRHGTWPED